MRLRRASGALLAWAVTGCSIVTTPPGVPPGPPEPVRPVQTAAERPPARRFEEVRGVWVVRMTLNTPGGVRNMVAQAAAGGINTLLVQVRGRGDAFYDSRWEPRGERVSDEPGFDPLALVIREAHARGMAVHAWVNTHLVWSGPELPQSPLHMVRAHPEWLAVPRALARELWGMDPEDPGYADALMKYTEENGETVEGIYSSPSSTAVQARLYDIWMDLVEGYDLDGIHFDYVRFPAANYDYSKGALDRFRNWVRERLDPARFDELEAAYRGGDPFAFTDALPDPWREFRRAQITGLVDRAYQGIKARRPDLIVSAAVISNADDAYRSRFQDWRRWLDEGLVDIVIPMAYTPRDDLFRAEIAEAVKAAGSGNRIWAGIGAYLNGFDGTLEKIDIARESGVGGIVLFSYDWATTDGSPAGSEPFLERVRRARFGRN